MIVVFIFILGLFVGSFLNVVIYRLHRQESFIKGSSKCLFCGHRLYAKDLVPIFSWIFLKGRCRYCRRRFSCQYPLVELSTAVAFSLIFVKLVPELDIYFIQSMDLLHLIFWWVMVSFLIIIFVYDLKYFLILDKLVIPAAVVAFLGNILFGYSWSNLVLAGLVGGGFFLLQFLISKGRWIGGGDIRLGFLIGVFLGWPYVLVALFIAYLLGSIIGIILLIDRKKKWTDKVAFGTFLTIATFITLLYGPPIVRWYWNLFII